MLGGQRGWVRAVALGRVGDRDFILTLTVDGAVRLIDIDVVSFRTGRTLIRGPAPETFLDLVPEADGGYRVSRMSDDVWRYWQAQGFIGDQLVNFPIDDMPRA